MLRRSRLRCSRAAEPTRFKNAFRRSRLRLAGANHPDPGNVLAKRKCAGALIRARAFIRAVRAAIGSFDAQRADAIVATGARIESISADSPNAVRADAARGVVALATLRGDAVAIERARRSGSRIRTGRRVDARSIFRCGVGNQCVGDRAGVGRALASTGIFTEVAVVQFARGAGTCGNHRTRNGEPAEEGAPNHEPVTATFIGGAQLDPVQTYAVTVPVQALPAKLAESQ